MHVNGSIDLIHTEKHFFTSSVLKYARVFQFVIEITYVNTSAVIESSNEILFLLTDIKVLRHDIAQPFFQLSSTNSFMQNIIIISSRSFVLKTSHLFFRMQLLCRSQNEFEHFVDM